MRAVPASPADVESDPVFGNPLQSVIDSLDLKFGPFSVAGDFTLDREPPVPDIDQSRVVDLQDESGIDDGFVCGVAARL